MNISEQQLRQSKNFNNTNMQINNKKGGDGYLKDQHNTVSVSLTEKKLNNYLN